MDLTVFHRLDMVIVCGLPNSGKSHFSAKHFKDMGRERINRKELRKLLYSMTHFGDKWDGANFDEKFDHVVKHTEKKIIEYYFRENKKILVDNTSVTALSRRQYVNMAKEQGKSVGVIFINTPVSKCIERNHRNEDNVSDMVISNLYAQIALPDKSEGFRELLVLNDY